MTSTTSSQGAYDTFFGTPLNQSLASTLWNSAGTWDAKTYLVGDGNGNAKVNTPYPTVIANYLAQPGDVGQAVHFRYVAQKDDKTPLLSIGMDGPGSTTSNYEVNGIQATIGPTTFYARVVGSGAVSDTYALVVGNEYCLEICKDATSKNYNTRLSTSFRGVRGEVIAAASISIPTPKPTTDRVVQLATGTGNKNAVIITRVEALLTPFEAEAVSTPAPSSGPGAPPPPPAPPAVQYLFPDPPTAVSGPSNLVVKFGPTGNAAPIGLVEKIYSAMPVGFGTVVQDRWMSRPITVNGIQFVLFPGMDSDGRADCWIYGAFATANTQTAVNREHAAVDLQVTLNGVALDLFGEGTTYSYNHQRTTWLRWESAPMPWDVSHDHLTNLINSGTFLRHDSRNVIGSDETLLVDEKPLYKPFKAFSESIGPNGKPYYDQAYKVGTQLRGTSAGGERLDIGPVHEWFARLVSEVGTNNNPTWLNANKEKSIRYLAESIAQFPHASGLVFPLDQRLIDPSAGPFSTHRNSLAWTPCIGIPQAGMSSAETKDVEGYFDSYYDNAHSANKVSYHAHALSKDPWHLFLLQAQAVNCLAYGTGIRRGSDGKTLRITPEEERGMWWGFQSIVRAWKATPEGEMPKPFRNKAFFEKAIDNTLDWIRTSLMAPNPDYATPAYRAAKFWRATTSFTLGNFPGEVFVSPFMCDYGNFVLGETLMLGYTKARDVVEWRSENIRLRAQAGGSWYAPDRTLAATGNLGQSVGPATGNTLPYTDIASYKAWNPRRDTAYSQGNVVASEWFSGRDMYIFMGVLNLYKDLKARGLVTLAFDPETERQALIDRHPPPYTINNIFMGCHIWAKQMIKP